MSMTNEKAIDLLRRMQEPEAYEPQITEEAFEALELAIRALGTGTNVGDLISRQAAIDILRQMPLVEVMHDVMLIDKAEAMTELMLLPPAPPEIIYCKDCGHRDDHGCCKYWRGLAMSETPIATDDYDFCNHARRREREH